MIMNPEIKAKWVAALRSGEYEQGRGYMRLACTEYGVKHCCLGVLTELAMADGVDVEVKTYPMDYGVTLTLFDGGTAAPSGTVWEWAGASRKSYNEPRERAIGELMRMNDGTGAGDGPMRQYSFEEIADWIEKNM